MRSRAYRPRSAETTRTHPRHRSGHLCALERRARATASRRRTSSRRVRLGRVRNEQREATFVSISNSNVIYAVAGLGIFGAFTIFDFNRLRRADADSTVVIATSIFLDIFNIFLLALNLFGDGQRE